MTIEELYCWEVICTPWVRGPIRSVTLYVEAKSRKDAELIVLEKAHKFFDQDMHYIWGEPIVGYRRLEVK